MSHPQRLVTCLLAVAALVAAMTLVATPASGQEGVKVFVVRNDMVNNRDKGERWQMQVTARPVGVCTPTRGDTEYSSPWIDAGAELGIELSLGECVFRISVALRQASNPANCWYTAQLNWRSTDPNQTVPPPADNFVSTLDRPTGVSRISVVRKPNSHCALPREIYFHIDGTRLVEHLPGPSADADLLALARRAAELAEFEVRLEPDGTAGSVPAGCDRTGALTVRGDGRTVPHALEPVGGSCEFQASIVRAQAPFEAVQDRIVSFSDNAYNIDLTSLARLPQARIAIVQDVRGSANQGTASYTIARSCGDRRVTSPAATVGSAPLQAGRYTVHAPHVPSFGATAVYPAVAAGEDADTIVGCSVRASVQDLPVNCVVVGGSTQTLTWTETDPILRFDFEFVIRCGTAATSTGTTVPTTGAVSTPTTVPEEAADMFEVSEPDPAAGSTAPRPPEGPGLDMPTG